MQINATFVHFIVLQILSLLYALVVKGLQFEATGYLGDLISCAGTAFTTLKYIGYGFGCFLFVYALSLSLAATFALMRIMKLNESFTKQSNKKRNGTMK